MAIGKKHRKLVATFHAQVKAEIEKAERQTSVEFVAVVTESSSRYLPWLGASAVLAVVFYLAIYELEHSWSTYGHMIHDGALVLLCLWLLGVFFWHWHLWLVPKHEMQAKVETKAKLSFLEHEVFATKQRTGVLIFISLLEKSVYVMGDRGLNKHVAHHEWAELGQTLARDFAKHSTGDTFINALHKLVARLAKDFPPEQDSQGQLSNEVHED